MCVLFLVSLFFFVMYNFFVGFCLLFFSSSFLLLYEQKNEQQCVDGLNTLLEM